MEKTSIAERAETVSSFCTKNEIEYLTYHAPIIKESIYDKNWNQIIINSIYNTIQESRRVISEVDISHQLYSNYLIHGKGNLVGDLERDVYGRAPSREECIATLRNSLVHLHISDATGFLPGGEGFRLGRGEIPITKVLKIVNSLGRTIQGTIELSEEHLYRGRFQMEAADWLLTRVRDVFTSGWLDK